MRGSRLLPAASLLAVGLFCITFPQRADAQLIYDTNASVRMEVTPKQTEVYIDGSFVGTVDSFDGIFQRLHIPPGAHEVTLYLDGYRTVHQRVYLQPTGTFRLRYKMEPLAAGDTAEPRPVPQAQPGPPQAGAYGPPVQAPPPYARGPFARPRRYPPPPTRAEEPQPPAEPGAPADSGTLSILVQPSGADVVIDGERWQGAADNERLDVHVAVGPHHIEVRHDGYRTYQIDVVVRPGETAPVNISLSRQ